MTITRRKTIKKLSRREASAAIVAANEIIMTLHRSCFTGRADARDTHNNFLANYEIVIRLHGAHTNIVTLRKTWSQLCTGSVRKDARTSRKALSPCVSGNNEQKSTHGHAGFYAKLCKNCKLSYGTTCIRKRQRPL